jgi:putative transposase
MDGRGGFSDNIFVERPWRSFKYEEVYLKAYENVAEARHSIAAYFDFYNHERLHQALGYRAPRQVFEEAMRFAKLPRGRKTAVLIVR